MTEEGSSVVLFKSLKPKTLQPKAFGPKTEVNPVAGYVSGGGGAHAGPRVVAIANHEGWRR